MISFFQAKKCNESQRKEVLHTIIICDDNVGWTEVLCLMLDQEPHFKVVALAYGGIEAIELIGKLRPDICLCQAKNGPVFIIENSSTLGIETRYNVGLRGDISANYPPSTKLSFGFLKPSDGFLESAAFVP